MDQTHEAGPEESAIINDDIAYMGQDPPADTSQQGDALDFGAQNGGFLDSTPNPEGLNSVVSKRSVDNQFLLASGTEPVEETKPENTGLGLGGFLSDDEPSPAQTPAKPEESIDFGDMKTYMKTEHKPSGRFEQDKSIHLSIDRLKGADVGSNDQSSTRKKGRKLKRVGSKKPVTYAQKYNKYTERLKEWKKKRGRKPSPSRSDHLTQPRVVPNRYSSRPDGQIRSLKRQITEKKLGNRSLSKKGKKK